MGEVDTTVSWLKEWDARFALLHCVSAYPTPGKQANLCWINELANRFDVPVGYSDHTTETICGALAVAAGATIVERHLTHDRSARGPDHAASSDPSQFQRYIKLIREADVLKGAGSKHVQDIEQSVRSVSRQSLVLRRTLEAGNVLREEDLTVQRPGTGLPAAQIMDAIGRKLNKPVMAGTLLQWDMLDAA
jgi:N,N'-diacetyllegionaminate synthase